MKLNYDNGPGGIPGRLCQLYAGTHIRKNLNDGVVWEVKKNEDM
jgi:hypothetical protein